MLLAVVTADLSPGSGGFRAAIAGIPADVRDQLMRLADWADSLEREGLAELATFHGKEVTSLRPRIAGDVAGLVSIACDVRSAYVQFWRSVFERCAPQSTALVEAELGSELKQGNSTHEFPEPLIEALTQAYQEAAARKADEQA
jgi:hypothetical protein